MNGGVIPPGDKRERGAKGRELVVSAPVDLGVKNKDRKYPITKAERRQRTPAKRNK